MIKTIVKRNGIIQEFAPEKINKWGEWASKTLGQYVDWSSVVLSTVSVLPEQVTSIQLQEQLIKTCLDYGQWSYNRMAGRLYAALLRKQVYPNGIPTVKELHKKLIDIDYMIDLGYSDEEYQQIEKLIDHKKDFKASHSELSYTVSKYALQNRITKEKYETQQFIYMRMAMALAKTSKPENKMIDVANWYKHFSDKKLNAPTPNYVNLGTSHNGYASCCLITADDTARSLAIQDHIAYTMTYMSAGIGTHLNTRSLGDPVRGGQIKHQGKLPYYRSMVGAVKANKQGERGGAATTHYNMFDPEVSDISQLKNPMSTEDKKIRGMDYSAGGNKFFARKAAKNEKVFTFNSFTAPDLYDALYSEDLERFEELYSKYENDDSFKKNYIDAREVLIKVLNEGYETGRAYLHWLDEMNRHTPFKDTIHSSNLCVAPETEILTDVGYVTISDVENEYVNVWNGEEWSNVLITKTGENQKLITVTTDSGQALDCTPYHKFYVVDSYGAAPREVRAIDLKEGDKLIKFNLPDSQGDICLTIQSVVDHGRIDDTYCFNEPKRHMGMFNGILTGQCQEIALPTAPYYNMKDLYSDSDTIGGHVKLSNTDGQLYAFGLDAKLKTKRGWVHGINLNVGDVIDSVGKVANIHEKKAMNEVALCSLAGINVDNITSDEEYESAAYYALLMIDRCIHMSDFELPHVGVTAKNRLNAGVGIIGLAHYLAKNKSNYSTLDGKRLIHEVAERHSYFLIKASLQLGKELGNAPWIHRTKWPEGWLPIDTYNRNVDNVVDNTLNYDWETLRQEIIANGGIRNSALVAHMPSESSSKASGTTNGLYPVRDLSLLKGDGNNITYWCAPNGDRLKYELAWDIATKDMIDAYAIVQKFTDQGISADLYRQIIGDDTVGTKEMLSDYFYMTKMGFKTRYYVNSKTSAGIEMDNEEFCASCTL